MTTPPDSPECVHCGGLNPLPLPPSPSVEPTPPNNTPEDGVLKMTYPDGSVANIKVPASAICKHKAIRALCEECEP